MSALGQKRTWLAEFAMSALLPKADIDERDRNVRLCQKQTFKIQPGDQQCALARMPQYPLTEVLAEGVGFAQLRAA
jgi:hypothetical protein